MIKYVEGNLFDFIDDHNPVVIAHVCNNQGAWGAGFVVPLGQKYPVAELAYRDWYNWTDRKNRYISLLPEIVYENEACDLGFIQIVQAKPHIHVVNMVAQTLGGQRPLHYNYLCSCMDLLADWMIDWKHSHIICPQFGSGLAGGDWNVIEQLIIDCWIRAGLNVTVVRYKP